MMDAITETTAPDRPAALYPAIYRFTLGWRLFVGIVYGGLLCGAMAGIYALLSAPAEPWIIRTLLPCLLIAAFATGTVRQLVIFLTWRATLTEDAIETRSRWSTRRIGRDQVDGYRVNTTGQGSKTILVVAAQAGLKTIRLPLRLMQPDAALSGWFSGLRDLNAEDLRNSVAAIAMDASFGATPEERLRRLARARKIAGGINVVTFAVVLWGLIDPQPYPLVIGCLMAIPALALILVAVSRGLFRIGIGATAAHANLGTACALPAFVLLARVLLDFNLVDIFPLIGAAAAVGAAFVAMLAAVDRSLRTQRRMLLGLALVAGTYGFGAIGEADALLDRSPPTVQQGRILAKRVSYGRSTRYLFTLAPWGPRHEPAEVTVSHELYDRLEPGNPVCMVLHDGALGLPWFIVLRCR